MVWLERSLLLAGMVALGVFFATYHAPRVQAQQAVSNFQQNMLQLPGEPDSTLWSPERITAYREQQPLSSGVGLQPVIGIFQMARLAIEAPIYSGSTDPVLDRGIGWIENTAAIGQTGNVGLAAHRDGYFRALKDVQKGDEIHVSTLDQQFTYTVTGTDIVFPTDVYVLEPTAGATLTLVTCYPFYFVGSAPQRFVVYATKVDANLHG